MTGPEHYREAQRLLAEAVSWDSGERQMQGDAVVIAAAQVHATLALAAATVAHALNADGSQGVRIDWIEATS